MRGTWDDVNRRLVGALLALDADDVLTVGDIVEKPSRGVFGRLRPAASRPRRWVSVTATRGSLVGEVVGSTRLGGEWEMSPETEAALLKMGWEEPWSEKYRTFSREMPLQNAPRMALAVVRALETLGCEVAGVDAELTHEEPEA